MRQTLAILTTLLLAVQFSCRLPFVARTAYNLEAAGASATGGRLPIGPPEREHGRIRFGRAGRSSRKTRSMGWWKTDFATLPPARIGVARSACSMAIRSFGKCWTTCFADVKKSGGRPATKKPGTPDDRSGHGSHLAASASRFTVICKISTRFPAYASRTGCCEAAFLRV